MLYIIEVLREDENIIVTFELPKELVDNTITTIRWKPVASWMHVLYHYGTGTDSDSARIHKPAYLASDIKTTLNENTDLPTRLRGNHFKRYSYTLPASPRLALDFLSIIDIMAAERMVSRYMVYNEKKYYNDHQAARQIAKQILAIAEPPARYTEALSVIRKIYAATLNSSITFADCQDLVKRHGLLTDCPLDLGNTLIPTADKMRALNSLVCHFTAAHRYAELTDMLNNFNRAAKIKLYAPCIGKDTHDKLRYSWTYMEWHLINAAKFSIRADGKLGILVKGNPAYQTYYAPGKPNELLLKDEINFLFSLLNLQIESDCNVHDEIVFTEDSSRRLIAMGLHIDADYVKQLIAFKNKLSIFGQAYRQPWGDGQNNTSIIPAVPKDIFRHMAKQRFLSTQALEKYEQHEFFQLGFFRPQPPAISRLSSAASAAATDQTTQRLDV